MAAEQISKEILQVPIPRQILAALKCPRANLQRNPSGFDRAPNCMLGLRRDGRGREARRLRGREAEGTSARGLSRPALEDARARPLGGGGRRTIGCRTIVAAPDRAQLAHSLRGSREGPRIVGQGCCSGMALSADPLQFEEQIPCQRPPCKCRAKPIGG